MRGRLNEVRATRGYLRLIFHPNTPAAEDARKVLLALRRMKEVAESFYLDCQPSGQHGREAEWRAEVLRLRARNELRATHVYEQLRDKAAWDAFDDFAREVWGRLRQPSWDEPASLPRGSRAEDPDEVMDKAQREALPREGTDSSPCRGRAEDPDEVMARAEREVPPEK